MASPDPRAKRRKISEDDDDSILLPPSVDGYITLAEANLTIECQWSPHPPVGHSKQVGIKNINLELPYRCFFLLSSPTEEPLSMVTAEFGNSPPSELIVQILEDCEKYDSTWKKKRVANSLPAPCTRATVTLLEQDEQGSAASKRFTMNLKVLWPETLQLHEKPDPSLLEILHRYHECTPSFLPAAAEAWDPRQFYDSVHVPEKNDQNSADLHIDLLQSQLYPFQRRAVRWLLKREGCTIGALGRLEAIPSDPNILPIGFQGATDQAGRRYYFHSGLGLATTDLSALRAQFDSLKGGILAEEMGLGKTIELLALFCLHPCPDVLDEINSAGLKKSRATLIITPPTILEQWKQEIATHAPSLKVCHYNGVKASKDRKSDVQDLADNDIVLTTYNVIAREVHYVLGDQSGRKLRHQPRYERPKSPLTEISWWRVCLDEAQMVESGVSAAARVAQMIPRINAWAVSGTPLRRDHTDIFGLMLFLRYLPWSYSLRTWSHLVEYHRPMFRSLINELAIRHSKELVREDLRLPPQTRHVISLPFTAIEEQNYSQLFQEMCDDCGLDTKGAPLTEDWDPEAPSTVEMMRGWLTRLRQTCLHPEVGGRNRRALGRTEGPLRSVLQVLDVMIDQNESRLLGGQRSLMQCKIQQGQMLENATRIAEAKEVWQTTYGDVSKLVEQCRAQFHAEVELQQADGNNKDTVDLDEYTRFETHSENRVITSRQRLRSALEVQHVCIFFIGNAFFQLKSSDTVVPDSDEYKELERHEEAAYAEAKAIRAELLTEVLKKASGQIATMEKKATEDKLTVIPRLHVPLDSSGIESRKLVDKLCVYCESMNRQAEHFFQVRQTMLELMRTSLVDEEDGRDIKGDEYEKSMKLQDHLYTYMDVVRAIFADRSDALTGQQNALIAHEMKLVLKAAQEGGGHAPELLIRLLADRDRHRVPTNHGSLRGIISEIRSLKTNLEWQEGGGSSRARSELAITDALLRHTQQLMTEQNKSITALEQEVNLFRETMNTRLDYYRGLQRISDTVRPYEEQNVGKPLDMAKFQEQQSWEERYAKNLSKHLAKRRYLLHLKTESSSSQAARVCTICQCEFEIGTLTVCGHHFCKDCLRLWISERRNCPVCKRHLDFKDFWDITYKPAEMRVEAAEEEQDQASPAGLSSPESSTPSPSKSIYSDISTSTLNEIKDIELTGASFGSKLDTICRHLTWLRYHDPGSKAIIFSQYRDFLDVLSRAFTQHKITYTRFDKKKGVENFKTDPAIECFLLHATAASSGLNLVIANHVILCEPLINTAIELQAIARVHRIGQHRATTVWMYLVRDSVEEAIYDISVQRRMAIVQAKDKGKSRAGSGTATPAIENAIESANSRELQVADLSKMLNGGKSGGEIVGREDLWGCLFGGKVANQATGRDEGVERRDERGEIPRFLSGEAVEERREDGSRE